jgi:hypothetical protein
MKNSLTLALIPFLLMNLASAKSLIIGGEVVAEKSPLAQSVVSLVDLNGPEIEEFCTGTIVSPRVILTATHCLEREFFLPFKVAYGTSSRTAKLYEVQGVKLNLQNYYQKLWRMDGWSAIDVAIILLKEPIEGNILTIKSPKDYDLSRPIRQVGFGCRSALCEEDATAKDFGELYKLDTNVISEIQGTLIKVTEFAESRSAAGDSGGPLLTSENEILGVVSSGFVEPEAYANYAAPYFFINWMNCALPADSQIKVSNQPLTEQVECDGVPLTDYHDLMTMRRKQCQDQLPGFDIVNGDCFPNNEKTCVEESARYPDRGLIWNPQNNSCEY